MEINLIIGLRNQTKTRLMYSQGIDKDKKIKLTRNEDEAERIPFNSETFTDIVKLPRILIRMGLSPVFLFELKETIQVSYD